MPVKTRLDTHFAIAVGHPQFAGCKGEGKKRGIQRKEAALSAASAIWRLGSGSRLSSHKSDRLRHVRLDCRPFLFLRAGLDTHKNSARLSNQIPARLESGEAARRAAASFVAFKAQGCEAELEVSVPLQSRVKSTQLYFW